MYDVLLIALQVSVVNEVYEKRLLTVVRQNNESVFRVYLVILELNIWLLHMFEGNPWKN
jgi:hypothetical protein